MNDIFVVKNLSHSFKEESGKVTEALKDVSFSVRAGEFFTVLGPSGCGKSTLLRILGGMISRSRGMIEFPRGLKLAMIFQSSAIFPWLNVKKNVEFGLKMAGISLADRRTIVKEHLTEVGLERFAHVYPKDLSGGMKQRVGVARALAVNPDVLLMDEAFSALDEFTAEKLRKEVLDLWLKDKMTVIMVTHSVKEAIEMSDRIAVMTPRPGKIENVFNVDFPRPRDPRDKAFFDLEDKIKSVIKFS